MCAVPTNQRGPSLWQHGEAPAVRWDTPEVFPAALLTGHPMGLVPVSHSTERGIAVADDLCHRRRSARTVELTLHWFTRGREVKQQEQENANVLVERILSLVFLQVCEECLSALPWSWSGKGTSRFLCAWDTRG